MKLPPKNDPNQFTCTTTTEYLARVVVLIISHKYIHGMFQKDYSAEIGIYSTKENALAALFDYVKIWWEEFELEPQLGKIPENGQKAIKKYFKFMNRSFFSDNETYFCKILTVDANKRMQIDL